MTLTKSIQNTRERETVSFTRMCFKMPLYWGSMGRRHPTLLSEQTMYMHCSNTLNKYVSFHTKYSNSICWMAIWNVILAEMDIYDTAQHVLVYSTCGLYALWHICIYCDTIWRISSWSSQTLVVVRCLCLMSKCISYKGQVCLQWGIWWYRLADRTTEPSKIAHTDAYRS